MSLLLTPYSLKNLSLKNRIVMSPMCQYSVPKKDGRPTDYHFTHYTSRAVGGVGLILFEMTDVEPDGRITDYDLGLWSDDHIPAFARIVDAIHAYGAKVGVQLGHAGRKAQDATVPVAPSAIRFEGEGYKVPREMTTDDIKRMVERYADAAKRAVQAGMDTIELHGAHGYLIHQFQSSYTNVRKDEYGEDKSRFGVEVIQAVKSVLPSTMPLIFRISAAEYVDGGYDLAYSQQLCATYAKAGVDAFDVSSGGEGPIGSSGRPGVHPGYQLPLAYGIKLATNVPVLAVGKMEDPALAESALGNGYADLINIGRALLRDPYYALHVAQQLGDKPQPIEQYQRAF